MGAEYERLGVALRTLLIKCKVYVLFSHILAAAEDLYKADDVPRAILRLRHLEASLCMLCGLLNLCQEPAIVHRIIGLTGSSFCFLGLCKTLQLRPSNNRLHS